VWHILNEVAKDAHVSAEEMHWLLEQEAFETLRSKVKKEVASRKWRAESRAAFLARCKEHRANTMKKKTLKEMENFKMLRRVERTREQNLKALERTQAELIARRSTLWAPPTSWDHASPAPRDSMEVTHPALEDAWKTAAVKLHQQKAPEHRRSPAPDLEKALPATPVMWGTISRDLSFGLPRYVNESRPSLISKNVHSRSTTDLRRHQATPTLRGGHVTRPTSVASHSPASRSSVSHPVSQAAAIPKEEAQFLGAAESQSLM